MQLVPFNVFNLFKVGQSRKYTFNPQQSTKYLGSIQSRKQHASNTCDAQRGALQRAFTAHLDWTSCFLPVAVGHGVSV